MDEKIYQMLIKLVEKGRVGNDPAGIPVQGVYALGVLETLVPVVWEMQQEIEKLKEQLNNQ